MIKIICVGKIKEKYFKEAIDEYQKRISKYTKINIIEVADEAVGDILKKEANYILKYIDERDYVITLEIEGEILNSIELANKIDKIFITNPNIIFVIGGSYGLHKDIKNRSNLALSFSKLTFPYQLFRIILLEQIYRCFKINNNESYHK